MENLLLFLSPFTNPQKDAIAATLAWLAETAGSKFEIYYESRSLGKHFSPYSSKDNFGSTVTGGLHRERFLLLSRFFDIKCVIHGQPELFSRSFLRTAGAEIIAETQDLASLYQKTFSYFNIELPSKILIVETRSFESNRPPARTHAREGRLKNLLANIYGRFRTKKRISTGLIAPSPYSYPEIFYRRALGVGQASISNFNLHEIVRRPDIYTFFLKRGEVDRLKELGAGAKVIDEFKQGDSYWSITNRIVSRWRDHSTGVAYCDPVLSSYWLPWLCRHKKLAVYEQFMEPVRNQMRDLVLSTEDRIVYGRHSSDRDLTELSKGDIIFQLIAPGRPPFPVMEEARYELFRPKENYYELEPDEHTLRAWAAERKILCTVIFYCPDLRHVETLPRIHELAALTKMKAGLALTAQWYQMVPDILEMINVPIENGGVFPSIEPLLCSAGLGVGVEAKGFLKEATVARHLREARKIISEKAGKDFLPKGYYPFLDTIRDYSYSKAVFKQATAADPSFKTIEDIGFEYSISYLSPGRPKALYKSNDFIAINHTSKQWHPYSPFLVMSNLKEIQRSELSLALRRKPGWIVASLDSPLWFYSYYLWQKSNDLFGMSSYLTRGGSSGKLLNTTPHVISRYARILDDEGLL